MISRNALPARTGGCCAGTGVTPRVGGFNNGDTCSAEPDLADDADMRSDPGAKSRTPGAAPDHVHRRFVVIAVVVVALIVAAGQARVRGKPSDFAQSWAAARYLVRGLNPYDLIGPDKEFVWTFPYLYPLTGAIAALPFAWLPVELADLAFFAVGTALLAWSLTRDNPRNPQLWVFASLAFAFAAETVQWTPLILASALTPALGFLLAAKPTVGVAYFIAYPSKQAAIGASAFFAVSVILWPWWIPAWLAVLPAALHMTAPIVLPGGFVLALALLKWRRSEARLLFALACIPHTVLLYEAIPLFLVVKKKWEGAVLSALTAALLVVIGRDERLASLEEGAYLLARWQLWLLYLPCLAMLLARPNAWSEGDGLAALVDWWSRWRAKRHARLMLTGGRVERPDDLVDRLPADGQG